MKADRAKPLLGLPQAQPVTLPDDPAELRRLATLGVQAQRIMDDLEVKEAKRTKEAAGRAAEVKRESQRKPKPIDPQKLGRLLGDASISLMALRDMAHEAATWDQEQTEHLFCLIEATANDIGRTVEACCVQLTGDYRGYFEDELDRVAAEREQHHERKRQARQREQTQSGVA